MYIQSGTFDDLFFNLIELSVQLPKHPCSFLFGILYLKHISLGPSLNIFQGEILMSGVAT